MTNSDLPEEIEQTQFESEAWLYDANKPVPVERDPNQPKVIFWKTLQGKIVIIAGTFVVVLILIAALAVARKRRSGRTAPLPDQTPLVNLNLGPLGDKVKALNLELKAADPTKELDPFPPVNLDARLDEKEH